MYSYTCVCTASCLVCDSSSHVGQLQVYGVASTSCLSGQFCFHVADASLLHTAPFILTYRLNRKLEMTGIFSLLRQVTICSPFSLEIISLPPPPFLKFSQILLRSIRKLIYIEHVKTWTCIVVRQLSEIIQSHVMLCPKFSPGMCPDQGLN